MKQTILTCVVIFMLAYIVGALSPDLTPSTSGEEPIDPAHQALFDFATRVPPAQLEWEELHVE